MTDMDRRSMLGLGVAAAAIFCPEMTTAQTAAGKELAPGVRQIDYGERDSLIPAYKKVRLRDIVIAPGAQTPEREMMNDMLCHLTEGELAVVQNKKGFTVRRGDVWTCAKGLSTEGTQNKGSAVAIMRIIDLLTDLFRPMMRREVLALLASLVRALLLRVNVDAKIVSSRCGRRGRRLIIVGLQSGGLGAAGT